MIESKKGGKVIKELTYEDWYNGLIADWKEGEVNRNSEEEPYVEVISATTMVQIEKQLKQDYHRKVGELLSNFKNEYQLNYEKSFDKTVYQDSTIGAVKAILGLESQEKLTEAGKIIFRKYFSYLVSENTNYQWKSNNADNILQSAYLETNIRQKYIDIILCGKEVSNPRDFYPNALVHALFQFLHSITNIDADIDKSTHDVIQFKDETIKQRFLIYITELNNELLENGLFKTQDEFDVFMQSIKNGQLKDGYQFTFNCDYTKKLIVRLFEVVKRWVGSGRRGAYSFIKNSGQFSHNGSTILRTNWQVLSLNDPKEQHVLEKAEELHKKINSLLPTEISQWYG